MLPPPTSPMKRMSPADADRGRPCGRPLSFGMMITMGTRIDPMEYGVDCGITLVPSGPFESGQVPKYISVDVSGVVWQWPTPPPVPMTWINHHFACKQDNFGFGLPCVWNATLVNYYSCTIFAESYAKWRIELGFYALYPYVFEGNSLNWLNLTIDNIYKQEDGYPSYGGQAVLRFGL